jgi:small-conductance mechanosensitive channel
MQPLKIPQSKVLSGYLSDISKILLGGTVINYFVSGTGSQVSPVVALMGLGGTFIFLGLSMKLST